jgi:hypothetical protein
MADNVAITAGSGTTVAADEVVDGTLGTVKVQYVKLMDGALDGTTKAGVGANGLKVDGSSATFPVTQATASSLNAQVVGAVASAGSNAGNPIKFGGVFNTTQPTVTNGQIVDIQTSARGAQIVSTGVDTFNVSVNAAIAAGSNIIGKFGIDQTTPGTTNLVSIGTNGTVAINTAIPTGANTIGNVGLVAGSAIIGKFGIDQTTPGTTNLVSIGTNGTVAINAAIPAGTNVIGKVSIDQTTPGTTNLVSIGTNGTVTANAGTGFGLVSTVNSTSANLGISGVFTGTSEDLTQYASVNVYVFSSHVSATDGLSIQFSSDGSNWDVANTYTIPATTGKSFNIQVAAQFYRLVYTNGGTGTTSLRIQSVFHKSNKKGSAIRPQDARSNENNLEEILSYGMYYNGTTWDRARGTIANGLAVDVTRLSALVAGSAIIGKVGIDQTTPGTTNLVSIGTSGSVTLLTGANAIGSITNSSFAATQATASSLNAQVVGAVASAGSNAGNPVKTAGVFNTTQPTVTNGQIVDIQTTARGAQIVSTGVDTFNVTVNAAIAAGSNIIGKFGIDQTTPGTTNLVSIGTNGTVAINTALPTGANAIGSITNTTFAATQATASSLNAQVVGAVASAGSNAGNPVKTAGVFNTTQPTVTNGQIVDIQTTARGAQIVATGTDTFNVTVNAAIPTGANTIGNVGLVAGSAIVGKFGIDQTTPGTTNLVSIGTNGTVTLAAGAAAIGSITNTSFAATQATASSLNAQVVGAVASAGSNAGNPIKIGSVFNTTQPTVTNGQIVDLQSTARGALIVSTGADTFNVTISGALGTGSNVIGKVSIDQTTPGTTNLVSIGTSGSVTLLTGSNAIGSITNSSFAVTQATASSLNAQVVGAVASGASNAGNPLKTGGVFNTTQPTVTNGQIVDLQATARGALIVSTGTDTFNVTISGALGTGSNTIGNVGLVAGSAIVGKFGIDQTTPGTTNLVSIGTSGSVTLLTGANAIGSITNTSFAATQATASSLNAQVVGAVASAGSNAGNPIKIGSVFNTTQPTVTNGQIVDLQSTARGALIVSTGTDTFNVTISGALGTGSNVIGKVSIDQTTPGTTNLVSIGTSGSVTLLTGANAIGSITNTSFTATQATAANLKVEAALAASQTLATVTTVSTVTNLSQMGGVAISLNTGVRDAGTQRVTIATNDVVPISAASLPLPTLAATSTKQSDGTQKTQIVDGAGAVISSLTPIGGTTGLLVVGTGTNFLNSTNNSTVAQLAASATFTGTVESILSQSAVLISLTSDQPGTLILKQYIDAGATRPLPSITVTVTAGVPINRSWLVAGNYFNLTFQNTGASTTTTLNISTYYGEMNSISDKANQTMALNEVNGTTISLGQTTMTASLPVVLASDQSALQVVGSVASGGANAGNPIKVGGVFNTTQPTVTNGQIVDRQSTARGAQIVATGVDAFNVTISGALGTGSNVIGKVSIDQTTPGTTNLVSIGTNGTVTANAGTGFGLVSTNNSTSANLAGAATFTGTSEDVSQYAVINITVFSSHASATDGLSIQFSSDGSNWDITDVYTIPATTGKSFSVQTSAQFYRLVYTNGGTLTTSLRIQSIFHKSNKKGSSVRAQDARSNENDFEEVAAYGMYYNGTNWDRARGTIANGLAVDVTRLSALVAGSAIIGKVGIDQTTPGTTNLVSIGTNGTVAINAAIPTGSNVIGKVSIDQTTPGTTNLVSIGTNGTVAINAALPTGANAIGSITNTTFAATQATASSLNAQVVGAVASAGTNAGNPIKIGSVFNTTQPTVTNGQIVDLQSTARGALIVSTGTDTFNVTISGALATGTNTIGSVKLTDGTNTATVKAASTAAASTDTAVVVRPLNQASSASIAQVTSSASNSTLKASNTARIGLLIYNDSSSALYVKFGATASTTSFTIKIAANSYYEMPNPIYTGIVDGIWASANGFAYVTELT